MFVISLNAKSFSGRINLFLGLLGFAFNFLLRGKYCWFGNVNTLASNANNDSDAACTFYEMNKIDSIHQRASLNDSVK